MFFFFILHHSAAHGRYRQSLMDQEEKEKSLKRQRSSEDVEKSMIAAKKRLTELERQVQSCNDEADVKATKCHQTGDMSFLAQSIGLREQAKKISENDIVLQRRKIKDLENKLL